MRKLVGSAFALLVGAAGGGAVGLWWVNDSHEAICVRLLEDCGVHAMPLDECFAGRHHDLLEHGVLATRRVRSCISAAPRDCLAVTACIAAAGDGS